MISHVVEFTCQYTNQIRKKHKIWHDGRLKYFELNGRFLLYSEVDNVLLSSSFKTNKKEIDCILNQEGFGNDEHQIFGQFLVIINEITCQYEREINGMKASSTEPSVKTESRKTIPKSSPIVSGPGIRKKHLISLKQELNTANSPAFSGPGLALKFNGPFKPPQKISPGSLAQNMKRPSKRNMRVKVNEEIDTDTSRNREPDTNIKLSQQIDEVPLSTNNNNKVGTTVPTVINSETSTLQNKCAKSLAIMSKTIHTNHKIHITRRPRFSDNERLRYINHTPIIIRDTCE